MSQNPPEDPPRPTPAPERALGLVHEGWQHLQLQRPLAAWGSWQRALRVDPESAAARAALDSLESAADLPASARLVRRFRPPAGPERRGRWDARLRGRNLEDLGEAAEAFAALAAEDPDDPSAWYNRALCLGWLGRNAEAISCLDRVVRLGAADDFEGAVDAWTLAAVLRQGAGAEPLADDLRYAWTLDWSEPETARLLDRVPELRAMPSPRDPVTGAQAFPDARVFEWLDRPMPEPSASLSAAELPRVLATAVITPRSLRLSSPDAELIERVGEPLARVVGDPSRDVRREASPLPLPLLDAAVWTFRRPPGLDAETEGRLAREAVEHYYEDLWIHRPRNGLEGRSPLEASRVARGGDVDARARLAAVVAVREELGARPRTAALYQGYPFDRLRRRLGLAPRDPAAVDPGDASSMGEDELDRLDPKALGDDALADAYLSASAFRDDRRTARFAAELVRINALGLARVATPSLFATLVREAMRADDPARALAWLEQARTTRGGRDLPTYAIWTAEVLARTGDPDAALAAYRRLLDEAGLTTPQLLDAAEDLLVNGYSEHAEPLLELASRRARDEGDAASLARARLLSGDEGTGGPPD